MDIFFPSAVDPFEKGGKTVMGGVAYPESEPLTLKGKTYPNLYRLHGLLMLPGKAKFVSCSIISLGLSF